MGEAQNQVDDLTEFAGMLDEAPAASGAGRASKVALIVFLVVVLATLGTGADTSGGRRRRRSERRPSPRSHP